VVVRNRNDANLKKYLSEFFNTIGTHAIEEVDVGSKIVVSSTITQNEWNEVINKKKKLEFSASVGYFGFYGEAGAAAETSSESTDSNFKSVGKAKTYTLGSYLPSGTTFKEKLERWAEDKDKLARYPSPIGRYKLTAI